MDPAAKGLALLPPGAGGVVDVVIPKKGRFEIVDQHLASRGLTAVLDAAQGEPEPSALVAARPLTPAERREKAKVLYGERCVACHDPPAGMMRMAPDLTGVTQRRPRAWLVKWLENPPKMQLEDETGKALLREWKNVPMPDMMLNAEQIELLLELLGGPATKKAS